MTPQIIARWCGIRPLNVLQHYHIIKLRCDVGNELVAMYHIVVQYCGLLNSFLVKTPQIIEGTCTAVSAGL